MTDVTFDAAASQDESASTWTHVNSDASNAILVACRLGALAEARVSAIDYGGVSLTELGRQVSFGDGNPAGGDGVIVFGKIGDLPTGSNTVSVTGYNQWGGSCTYENAGSFGDVFTSINTDGGGDSQGVVSISDTEVGGICFAATSFGNAGADTTAGTDATLRWVRRIDSGSGSGSGWAIDRPSEASSTDVGWSNLNADWFGNVGVEIKPAGDVEGITITGALSLKKMRASISTEQTSVVSGALSLKKMTFSAAVLTPVVIYAAYAFDEGSGTTIHDYSGNSRDMTVVGTNAWVTGQGDYAKAFKSGASGSDAAAFNAGSAISELAGDVTLQFWYQYTDTVPGTTLTHAGGLYSGPGTSRLAGYAYRSRSSVASSPHFTLRDVGGSIWDVGVNGTDAEDNDWHNAAAVYHASGLVEAYLDGTLIVSTSPSSNPIGDTVSLLAVGSVYSGAAAQAAIQDMRIFPQALSGSEIVTWMNTPVHQSANSFSGALSLKKMRASISTEQTSIVSGALSLKKMRASVSTEQTSVVSGALSLKKMRASISTEQTSVVSGALSLKKMRASISTEQTSVVSGALSLKKMRFSASVSTEQTSIISGNISLKKMRALIFIAQTSVITGNIRLKKMQISSRNSAEQDSALFIFSPL